MAAVVISCQDCNNSTNRDSLLDPADVIPTDVGFIISVELFVDFEH